MIVKIVIVILIQPGTKCPGVRGPSSPSPTRFLPRAARRAANLSCVRTYVPLAALLMRADSPRAAALSRANGSFQARRVGPPISLACGHERFLSSASRRAANLSRVRTYITLAALLIRADSPRAADLSHANGSF